MPRTSANAQLIDTIATRMRAIKDMTYQGNQAMMARMLQVNPQTLNRCLAGKQLPTVEILIALAEQPYVDITKLLTGRSEKPTPPETDKMVEAVDRLIIDAAQVKLLHYLEEKKGIRGRRKSSL